MKRNDFETKTSVIVPSLNSSKTILPLLESLEDLSYDRDAFEVIIVDDASQDNSPNKINKFIKNSKLNFKFIKKTETTGSGPTRNVALIKAKSRILAFTDADCIVHKDWLKNIEKYLIYENHACIGGPVISKKSFLFPAKRSVAGHKRVTANLAIDRKKIGRIYFDKRFGTDGGCDIDFIARIENKGFNYKYFVDVIVEHPPTRTTLKYIIRKTKTRIGENLFLRKHPQKIKYITDNILTKPILLNRFSLIFFSFNLLILSLFVSVIYPLFFIILIVMFLIAFLTFILFLYKPLVYRSKNDKNFTISAKDKIRSFFLLIAWYLTTFYARILGSVRFKHIFI